MREAKDAKALSCAQPGKCGAQAGNEIAFDLDVLRRTHQNVERANTRLLQTERLADAALHAIAHVGPPRNF